MHTNGDVKTNGKASVEEGDDDDDVEAGPEMPPDGEEAGVDDEEGRFFGGGITGNTADVLDFIDEQDNSEAVHLVWNSYTANTELTTFTET